MSIWTDWLDEKKAARAFRSFLLWLCAFIALIFSCGLLVAYLILRN